MVCGLLMVVFLWICCIRMFFVGAVWHVLMYVIQPLFEIWLSNKLLVNIWLLVFSQDLSLLWAWTVLKFRDTGLCLLSASFPSGSPVLYSSEVSLSHMACCICGQLGRVCAILYLHWAVQRTRMQEHHCEYGPLWQLHSFQFHLTI